MTLHQGWDARSIMCKPMVPLCHDFDDIQFRFVNDHAPPNNHGFNPHTKQKILQEPHSAAPAHLSADQYPHHLDIVSSPYLYTSGHAPGVTDDQPTDPRSHDTVSPLQTFFDSSSLTDSNGTLSLDGAGSPATLSNPASCPNPTSQEKRCDTLVTEVGPETVPEATRRTGRRRTSENLEPGSARAIYLEKNRMAASKCRNKQRRQQEQLVETARIAERQNKILKHEVHLLKNEVRELLLEVGRHARCPDTRLQIYVQREADRLAVGCAKSPSADRLSLERSTPDVPQ